MIKKMILILGVVMLAAPAFAQNPDPAVLKGFNASKNVTVSYTRGQVGSTGIYDRWAAISSHSSGDKQFFTSNAFGGLAYQTVTPGASITAPSASRIVAMSFCEPRSW